MIQNKNLFLGLDLEKIFGENFANTFFSAWDAAQTALKKAANQDEAQAAFTAFAATFNNCNDIETMERELIGDAVFKLAQLPRMAELGIDADLAQYWFDEIRDY